MRAHILRYVKDMTAILEVVREQCMYGVRYNRRVLEFLSQQIEKAALAVGDVQETPPSDELFDNWKDLEVMMERAKMLIEEHTQPFELASFYRVSRVVEIVESICLDIKGCLQGLGLAQRAGVSVKVDSDLIARDKLYMEWYLTCIFDIDDGALDISESVRSELEALRSENSAFGDRMHLIGESAFMWGRSIGQGNCSEVFQARWGRGFSVAVKKFNLTADGKSIEELAEFLTEAEISSKWMKHPTIVDCLAATKSGCLVMELAKKNLQQLYLEVREISWFLKIRLLTDAAEGLRHLHTCGIVHKAVKSPNFLVFGNTLEESMVKVADFGFPGMRKCCMHSSGSRGVKASDPWIAPENIDGKPCTTESDVFSFGIVMYEVASQSLPYGKFTSDQVPQRKEKWGEPCFGLMKCPEELKELMKQCINPNADERPSMATVCTKLEGVLSKVENPQHLPMQASPVANGVPRSPLSIEHRRSMEDGSPSSGSSCRYDIPRGMDPEKMAAELETFEVDLALEKSVRGVPSYVPGTKTVNPRQAWRAMNPAVHSSASRHSVGSSASITITLTGTSLVNSHEQSLDPAFEVSSFTENWVKSGKSVLRYGHDGRMMSASTVKSSLYQDTEPTDTPTQAAHHHDSSATEEETRHLMHSTAYEGSLDEAAEVSQRSSDKRSSSANNSSSPRRVGYRRLGSGRRNSGSGEERRMLHSTAFEGNSEYCTPSSVCTMREEAALKSVETFNTQTCEAIREFDEALAPEPDTVSTASTLFSVPAEKPQSKYTTQWILSKEEQLKRQSDGRTLLHAAAQAGNLELATVLVHQYVDVDKIDKYGRTALHDAARWGETEVAQLLLENHANPSHQDIFGNTPLHVAAMAGHLDVVRVLLEEDLDLTIKNKNRQRPQDLGDASVKELFRAFKSEKPSMQGRASRVMKVFGKSS